MHRLARHPAPLFALAIAALACKPTTSTPTSTAPAPRIQPDPTPPDAAPTPLVLTPAARMAGAGSTRCFLDDHGAAWCWLGTTPERVEGVPALVEVSVGIGTACGRTVQGDVFCWTLDTAPEKVVNVSPATAITAGSRFHCALGEDGKVRCWGSLIPQLRTSYGAEEVTGLKAKAVALASGAYTAAILDADGRVWIVGEFPPSSANSDPPPGSYAHGHLGGDNWYDVVGVRASGYGNQHAFGTCVSSEITGPLPRAGTFRIRFDEPARTAQMSDVDLPEAAAAAIDSCLRERGSLLSRAVADKGEIVAADIAIDHAPRRVLQASPFLDGVTGVVMHENLGCATTTGGEVICWGQSRSFDGDGFYLPEPTPLEELRGSIEIAIGFRHACGRKPDGTITCTGSNEIGALGIPPQTGDTRTTVTVPDLPPAVHITAGVGGTCALVDPPAVFCWGDVGEREGAHPPTAIAGLPLPDRW